MQAEETRSAILSAARKLFVENGWSATTIAAIAEKAGLASETIYARFGNKRAILHGLVVAAMRGAEPDTPFMEQERRKRVHDQKDPVAMVEAFAEDMTETLGRGAPILNLVRSAAETDAEMRDLYADLHASRLRNLGIFAEQLGRVGGLRSGLAPDLAGRHIWALASPELYLMATGVGGLDVDSYRAWLASALKAMLLPKR